MKDADVLNVAILGGGSRCRKIVEMILSDKPRRPRMRVVGVADIDPGAVGFQYAQKEGIFTTKDYRDFYRLDGLDLIVDLAGSDFAAEEMSQTKPGHIRVMDKVAARLFWELFCVEEQRAAEQKRAEEVVREKERFLRGVFDAIQDGLVVLDCDLNVIMVNPCMERMFAPHGGAIGGKCYAFYGRRSPCPRCPSVSTLVTGEVHSEVVAYPSAEYPARWIDICTFPIKNPRGEVVGIIEFVREITQRMNAEQALRRSEAQKRAILDASMDMIRYVDKDLKIVWANRRTRDEFGMTAGEIEGRSCYELFAGTDKPCEGCPTLKALDSGEIEQFLMNRPEAGEKQRESYWDCFGVPVKDESGEVIHFIQIARDVTENKRAEKELRKRQHELEAMNEVLLRLTKEDNLNGVSRVIEEIIEDLHPGFEAMIFLLNPGGEGFYFPPADRGQVADTCYDLAERRMVDLGLEDALWHLLAGEKVEPACSGRKAEYCPPVLQALAAGFKTWMAVPIELDGKCFGLFVLGAVSNSADVEGDLVFVEALVRQISGVVRSHIAKEIREEAFRKQLAGPDKFMGIVGQSQPMQEVYRMIQTVADSTSTVLITGESGTGKELVARAIHRTGKYRGTPFIAAHCSSFVPTLVHSEIFGHEKGAFTGAVKRRMGRLERAQGGILFLDEVADLPLETQVLLLRFLQDKSFERVGGELPIEVNVRVIAATNKDIEKEMKAGRLREDFYYRLNVISIKLPPLRERLTDVPLLADHMLASYCLIEEKKINGFDPEALRLLMDYDWPGNVRELQNTVARAVVLSDGDRIRVDALPEEMHGRVAGSKGFSLAKNERGLIQAVMREVNWNKHRAAQLLDISRGTLYSKLTKYNIRP